MIAILLSMRAKCWPMQFLCPELKGKQEKGSALLASMLFQRSGLNCSGCSQKVSLQWLVLIITFTIIPALMGIFPKKWSFTASLMKMPLVGLWILKIYFCTFYRYFISFSFSQVRLRTSLLSTFWISSLSFCWISVCLLSKQVSTVVLLEVVSVPAKKKFLNSSIKSWIVQKSFLGLATFSVSASSVYFSLFYLMSKSTTPSIVCPLEFAYLVDSFFIVFYIISETMSLAYSFNTQFFCMNYLSIALSLYLQKFWPTTTANKDRGIQLAISKILLQNLNTDQFSISLNSTFPKKHRIVMFPKISYRAKFRSILIQLCPLFQG